MEAQKQKFVDYLREVVNPILEPLVADLLNHQPDATVVIDHIRAWLDKQSKKSSAQGPVMTEESEEDPEEEKKLQEKLKQKKASNRQAVSAEVFGQYNKKGDFKPRVIPKSEDAKKRILLRLKQSFLFRYLDDHDTNIVLDAMEEKRYKVGEFIIKQGEAGDILFVVDQGELDCFKRFTKDGEEKYLKTYQPGESFGELALLYNAPRAATIKVKKDAVLFALDRLTFNNIVKESAQKRREQNEEILKKVELLNSIDPYELNQLSDVLKDQAVKKGEYVIQEGELGEKFYIISRGSFAAYKKNKEGVHAKVMSYKEGDYFGELALLKDCPRQASVIAQTDGKLVFIERETFKRVLGPVQNILKRNAEAYQKYMDK